VQHTIISEGRDRLDFEKRIMWIKWIGTHAEYDRIDVKEVER